MILLSSSKVWLWVQRYDGIWSFLKRIKDHFLLHRHPEVSLEVVEVETLLLEMEDPVPEKMFSVPDLFQRILFVHLRLGIWILFFLWERLLPLHWVFLRGFPMRPSFAAPQRLQPLRYTFIQSRKRNSSKNTFVQKHFGPKPFHPKQKTISSTTLSSKNGFIQWHFRQNRFQPMTLSSKP